MVDGHCRRKPVVLDVDDVHPAIGHDFREAHQRAGRIVQRHLYPRVAVREGEPLADDAREQVDVEIPAADQSDHLPAHPGFPLDERRQGGGARRLAQHPFALQESQNGVGHRIVGNRDHLIHQVLNQGKTKLSVFLDGDAVRNRLNRFRLDDSPRIERAHESRGALRHHADDAHIGFSGFHHCGKSRDEAAAANRD